MTTMAGSQQSCLIDLKQSVNCVQHRKDQRDQKENCVDNQHKMANSQENESDGDYQLLWKWIEEAERNINMNKDQGIPQTMDMRIVMRMFRSLKQEITDMKQNSHHNNRQLSNTSAQVGPKSPSSTNFPNKSELIMRTMKRMTMWIEELEGKVENLEMQNMRKSIVLTSFKVSKKKKVYISELENFFEEEMGIELKIEDIFYIGQSNPKPIIIVLQSVRDKALIFQNIRKLRI